MKSGGWRTQTKRAASAASATGRPRIRLVLWGVDGGRPYKPETTDARCAELTTASLRARGEPLPEEAVLIHAGPCWLPLLGRRVSAGYLARGGCGEVVDSALHPIAYPIVPHRRHLVVVGGVRFQTLQARPEYRFWMTLVEPDVIFRRLAQIVGIGPVVARLPN